MRGRARAPGDAQKTTGKPEYSIPSGPSGAAAGREPSPKSGNRLSSGVLGSKRKRSFRHRGRSGRGARRAACGTHRTRHTVFGTSETAAWDMALYETSENSCYSDFGAQDLRSSPLRVRARHLDVTVRLGGRAAAGGGGIGCHQPGTTRASARTITINKVKPSKGGRQVMSE